MEIKLNLNREACSIQDLNISIIILHYMLPTTADLAGEGEKGVKFELEKNVVEAPQNHSAGLIGC